MRAEHHGSCLLARLLCLGNHRLYRRIARRTLKMEGEVVLDLVVHERDVLLGPGAREMRAVAVEKIVSSLAIGVPVDHPNVFVALGGALEGVVGRLHPLARAARGDEHADAVGGRRPP